MSWVFSTGANLTALLLKPMVEFDYSRVILLLVPSLTACSQCLHPAMIWFG